MDWFYFYGGPLDWHKTGKMVQSYGMSEHVVQIADPLPCKPGEVMLYGEFEDGPTTKRAHTNHLYVRQHRGDWVPGYYSPSATYEYQYKGILP